MKTMDNLSRKLSQKVGRLFVGAVLKTADLGAGAASWGGMFQRKTPEKLAQKAGSHHDDKHHPY